MGGNNDTSESLVNESMDYIVKILRTPDMTQTESGTMEKWWDKRLSRR